MEQEEFIKVFDQYVCAVVASGQINDTLVPIHSAAEVALLLLSTRSEVKRLTHSLVERGGYVDADEIFEAYTESGK